MFDLVCDRGALINREVFFLCKVCLVFPSVCLYISLFLSLVQCVCACHVTPGPATNWVSPSFFLPLFKCYLSHTTSPITPPPTSLHRCLSVALSTAWSVPLSAGCMVVILKAACNLLGWGWGEGPSAWDGRG